VSQCCAACRVLQESWLQRGGASLTMTQDPADYSSLGAAHGNGLLFSSTVCRVHELQCQQKCLNCSQRQQRGYKLVHAWLEGGGEDVNSCR
jgi:hypothetical protein